jgi:hypothetical protein
MGPMTTRINLKQPISTGMRKWIIDNVDDKSREFVKVTLTEPMNRNDLCVVTFSKIIAVIFKNDRDATMFVLKFL